MEEISEFWTDFLISKDIIFCEKASIKEII